MGPDDGAGENSGYVQDVLFFFSIVNSGCYEPEPLSSCGAVRTMAMLSKTKKLLGKTTKRSLKPDISPLRSTENSGDSSDSVRLMWSYAGAHQRPVKILGELSVCRNSGDSASDKSQKSAYTLRQNMMHGRSTLYREARSRTTKEEFSSILQAGRVEWLNLRSCFLALVGILHIEGFTEDVDRKVFAFSPEN